MQETPEILIDYSQFLQNAMRNAIRELLRNVEQNGLPGEHHFYINFLTQHPNAIVSQQLINEYPKEMSIVIQHQFWNLKVQENGFSIQLGFGNKTETIFVPFDAMLSFNDPIAHFGLQFQPQESKQNQNQTQNQKIQKQTQNQNTTTQTITEKNQNNITKFPEKQTDIIPLKNKTKNQNKNKKINKKTNNVVTLDKFRNAKE